MGKDSHFTGQTVYSQVLKLLDKEKILQISRETKGSEAYVKRFDGYQHLVVMLFGILKHFDSLRELEIGMKAEAHKLGHLGMNYLVRRSTLAEANIRRPQEFFASVYAYLLEKYAKFLADSRPSKCYKGQTPRNTTITCSKRCICPKTPLWRWIVAMWTTEFSAPCLLWGQRQRHTDTDLGSTDCQSADNSFVKKHQETLCILASCYHGTTHAHVLRRFYRIHGKSRENLE